MPKTGYKFVRCVLNIILNIFFEEIETFGTIPDNVPVVIAANHNNYAIDGAMITCNINRQVNFMVKSTMFKGPIGMFLRYMGAIPIIRKQDKKEGEDGNNLHNLSEAIAVLKNNGCFGIFPEGVSHSDIECKKIKSGVALISLGAVANSSDCVYIIPTGINYTNPKDFRSKCYIHYGEPIIVKNGDTIENILNDVNTGLRKVTLNASSQEILNMANTASNIYVELHSIGDLGTQIKIKKYYLDMFNNIESEDDKELYESVLAYQKEIDEYGPNIYKITHRQSKLYQSIKFIFGIMLYFPFFLVHWPIYVTCKYFLNKIIKKNIKKTSSDDTIATYKILLTSISYLITHLTYFCAYNTIYHYTKMNYCTFLGLSLLSIYPGIYGYTIIKKYFNNYSNNRKMNKIPENKENIINKVNNVIKNIKKYN